MGAFITLGEGTTPVTGNLATVVGEIVDIMVDVCEDVMTLATQFPLNIFLGFALIGGGLKLWHTIRA